MMFGSLPAVPSGPYFPSSLNTNYPKAIDGDGVLILGPSDEDEMWIKSGSIWVRGDVPGSQRMTMEYRPSAKRIIDDQRKVWASPAPVEQTKFDPITGLTVVDFPTGGVSAGNLALIGLLGFLLLRGAIK